jgi:nicotinamidase-related amidase
MISSTYIFLMLIKLMKQMIFPESSQKIQLQIKNKTYFSRLNKSNIMRILREETAAVIVDIQERLLPHIHEGDIMLKNCLRLIDGLKTLSIPVIITQQYTKGLGPTVPEVIQMFPEFRYTEKISFSCCGEPAFEKEIDSIGKTDIIIFGIESHVCILQTCLDLLAAGRKVFVVEDCVSSRKPNDKQIAIERMRQEGARITTLESILFELTGKAGNETFKSISGIVK